MEVDDKKFDKLRKQAENDYESIGKVWCPYLKEDIHFNTTGFQHLLFKSWNRTRSRNEQFIRLKLLPLAVEVISKSHTLQEYNESRIFVRQKINSRWQKILKTVRYYVFIVVIRDKKVRIKVIVKEIDGGAKFFHSLYPSWKVAKDSFGARKKIFYSGDLEQD